MNLFISSLASVCLFLISYKPAYSYPIHQINQQYPSAGTIVHMFNFPFSKIEKELPVIANTGFKYIQISPPQLSRPGDKWFERYQPLDYRVIDGPLGNERDLRSLINSATKYGIGIIADVVLNHMADLGYDYNLSYPPKWAKEKYGLTDLFNYTNFHPAFCIQDYSNPEQVRKGRMCRANETRGGLPDLDLDQDIVLKNHRTYLKKLSDMGISGFRFDAAKHMELSYFQKLLDGGLSNGKLLFAEIIANRTNYDRDLTPYLQYTNLSLMDFPLQTTMKEAFSWEGDIRWLLYGHDQKMALPNSRSISFVINHDIPNNKEFRHLILNKTDESLAHIYMFARLGGTPHVYSDLGKPDGLSSNRWFYFHRNPVVISGVRFRNYVEGTNESIAYADQCALVIKRGSKGIATVNKCSSPVKYKLDHNEAYSFKDLLTNEPLKPGQDGYFKIPARSGQLLVK